MGAQGVATGIRLACKRPVGRGREEHEAKHRDGPNLRRSWFGIRPPSLRAAAPCHHKPCIGPMKGAGTESQGAHTGVEQSTSNNLHKTLPLASNGVDKENERGRNTWGGRQRTEAEEFAEPGENKEEKAHGHAVDIDADKRHAAELQHNDAAKDIVCGARAADLLFGHVLKRLLVHVYEAHGPAVVCPGYDTPRRDQEHNFVHRKHEKHAHGNVTLLAGACNTNDVQQHGADVLLADFLAVVCVRD